MKSEAHFPKMLPLAADATMLGMRLGRPSSLWNPSDDQSICGPDSDFPNGVSHEQSFQFQNSCTRDEIVIQPERSESREVCQEGSIF